MSATTKPAMSLLWYRDRLDDLSRKVWMQYEDDGIDEVVAGAFLLQVSKEQRAIMLDLKRLNPPPSGAPTSEESLSDSGDLYVDPEFAKYAQQVRGLGFKRA